MNLQVGVLSADPQDPAGWQAVERPLDQQVRAAVQPERAEVKVRIRRR